MLVSGWLTKVIGGDRDSLPSYLKADGVDYDSVFFHAFCFSGNVYDWLKNTIENIVFFFF